MDLRNLNNEVDANSSSFFAIFASIGYTYHRWSVGKIDSPRIGIMSRVRVSHVLKSGQPGTTVDVRGWVRTKRESKQDFAFLEFNDGSCMANVQIVVDSTLPDYASIIKQIHTGASVAKSSAKSKNRSERDNESRFMHSPSNCWGRRIRRPIRFKRRGTVSNFCAKKRILRPRTNTFGAIARVRNAFVHAIHNFFQARDFLYVQTPIITTSDCEGAGQVFQVTTLDLAKLQQCKGPLDYSHDFFGKKAGLTVSGQLEGEIFATAVGDVYTFGPTFRAENSNTTRHLAEFWMIEPEMPFYELEDNMDLAEAFVRTVVRECPGALFGRPGVFQ